MPKIKNSIGFLFLGGAKRVTMARMIKEACRARGFEARITGYELDANSALALEGDIVEGIRWSDPAIYADLDEVCSTRDIDIVIPFVDGAVGVASDFVRHHSSTPVFAPVSPRGITDRMFDKCAAAELFESLSLPIPATYVEGAPVGRLIAKPRFGSASKGIVEINTLQKLYEIKADRNRYLVQERIDHREEITVDCYVGVASGSVVAVSPRLRSEVSGGEVVRTETLDEPDVEALVRRTLAATGLRGAVTVQLIRDLDNGRLMIMEINPRLGGGAVASVHAGVDLPGLIVDDFLGRQLAVQTAQPGVETVRYLADVVFFPQN